MSDNHFDNDRTHSYTPLMKNLEVGHYRVVEKIGAGGMGEVYLAEDTRLERRVALKFLPHHLCQDENCRARFKREAQAAAKLDHPNIIPVYEVDEYQGRPYFAMAHVEGQSLKEYSAGKELSIEQVLKLGIQISEGLQAAHDKGITHRDIKPSNILIDSHGRARIVDFGLASVVGKDQLTKTGSTLGTVGYMSPEQVRGEKVDRRSDLFSAGVVLYEMITGHNPFRRETETGTIRAILDDFPQPLARFSRNANQNLQRVINKLLEKDPGLRYQTAADLISDLKRIGVAGEFFTKSYRYRLTLPLMVALVIVVSTVAAYFLWLDKKSNPNQSSKMIAVLPFANFGGPEDEYFSDGMTEEITSRLARISGFGVISRTSVMQYKGTTKGIPQIARELGVDYILEGSVRWDRSGDTVRVRITPQLIEASKNTHLWTDIYESPVTGIFEVQGSIALRIAQELDVTLLEEERQALDIRPTENSEAYSLYLRGRELVHQVDLPRENVILAIRLLERAVGMDSVFAEAWSQLGFAHLCMYNRRYDRTPERLQIAYDATKEALILRPDLGDGHLTMAYYNYWGLQQYGDALSEIEKARMDLDGTSELQYITGLILWSQRRYDESVGYLKQAHTLDPFDARISRILGHRLLELRRYSEALDFLNRSLLRRPDQQSSYLEKARVFMALGELDSCRSALTQLPDRFELGAFWVWIEYYSLSRAWDEAQQHLDSAFKVLGGSEFNDFLEFNDYLTMLRIWVYHASGNIKTARYQADSLRQIVESNIRGLPPLNAKHDLLAELYAVLGEDSAALSEINKRVDGILAGPNPDAAALALHNKARICTMIGEYDTALVVLEQLINIPYNMSANRLRLDCDWDPLRDDPRFHELIKKYEAKYGNQ